MTESSDGAVNSFGGGEGGRRCRTAVEAADAGKSGEGNRYARRKMQDLIVLPLFLLFFFFQAEDGIRDFDCDWSSDVCSSDLAAGKLGFLLCGEKLKGSFALVRTATGNQWLLIKHRDRFAQTNDVLARHASVLSGASLDELTPLNAPQRLPATLLAPAGPAEAFPRQLKPMLAEAGESVRSNPQWRYEPKRDGYRVIAFVHGGSVRLQARRGLDLTACFPELAAELTAQAAGQMILDGEIVALDGAGRPSFNALQNRAQLKTPAEIAAARRDTPVVLLCFDLLHFAGLNLRPAPYRDRHRYLAQCLLPAKHLQLVHASEEAEPLFAAALSHGFEGIMAKRLDSPYQAGRRSRARLKINAAQPAEVLIGGFTHSLRPPRPLRPLRLRPPGGNPPRFFASRRSRLL